MKKVISLIIAAVLLFSIGMTGCGEKQPAQEKETEAGVKEILFLADADSTSKPAFEKMVQAYNDGQGKTDGVYVTMKLSAGVSTKGENYFKQSSRNAPNVMMVSDQVFRQYAISADRASAENMGYFVNLNDFAAQDGDFDISGFPESASNTFRLTYSETDKSVAGAGQDIRGIPFASDMQVNYFNKVAFQNAGINIISCEEDALASEYPNLQPHGYAEYAEQPFDGAQSSVNLAGETVYKVFNNRIPMNWEEQRYLFKCFTKEYNSDSPTNYGYVSEYWFNYGWSVGGDVVQYNGEKYDFTLTDTTKNYLATKDVTVNGKAYSAGDIIAYEDKKDAASVDGLYEIPSMYDALCEFLKLSVRTDRSVDSGMNGYGISEPDVSNVVNGLITNDTAMGRGYYSNLLESFAQSQSMSDFDMCRSEQYREYEGGSTYQKGGQDGFANEYLKVIGNTYDGEVYTGELKKVNGTAIVGKTLCTANNAIALVIPSNSDPDLWQASWDFISWLSGEEGQSYLAESKTYTPARTSVALSDTYVKNESVANGYDIWVAAENYQGYTVGDWGYFEDGSWVTNWSIDFNSKVRYGTMTVSEFGAQYAESAANATNVMLTRVAGK